MKRLPFLILIAASILVCGCHRHDAFFQSVEDLIDSAPDSALALAEAFEPFGRAEKARRILLITKAKSKAYIDIADDSIIETAVDYYRGRNDSLEVQALYYSAARLTARNELDKALARLLTAEEKAEQINHSFYLAMIQRLASTCFHDVYVFNKAEEYAIKARQNFDKAHKPNHSLWCELIVADALLSNNKIDSAISVLQNNRNASDYNFEYEWHTTMAEAQFRAINNIEAINNYEWLKANAGSLSSRDYSKLSRCYIHTNNLIEAKNNLEKAEEYSRNWKDTVYFRMVASDISKIEGDIHNSFNLYKKAVDTLTTRYDNLLTHPYYNIINQTLNNDRKQYKEQAKVEKKLRLYATALIFLTIIIATTIIIVILKENKAKSYHIRLLISQATELKTELSSFSENEKRINSEAKSILSNHINLLNSICSEWYLLPESRKTEKIFSRKIESVLSEINSDDSIIQLENIANKYHKNLITNLCSECPKLTKENKQVIIYLALGLSYDSICFLTAKSKSTFAVYRHRLKKIIESSTLQDKESIIKLLFH